MTAAAFFFYASLAALRERLARSYGGTFFGFGECFEASASADVATPLRTVQLQDLGVESDIMVPQVSRRRFPYRAVSLLSNRGVCLASQQLEIL